MKTRKWYLVFRTCDPYQDQNKFAQCLRSKNSFSIFCPRQSWSFCNIFISQEGFKPSDHRCTPLQPRFQVQQSGKWLWFFHHHLLKITNYFLSIITYVAFKMKVSPCQSLGKSMHYGIRAMGAMSFRISELCLSFSSHPNISDRNFNLVHHFICVQIL